MADGQMAGQGVHQALLGEIVPHIAEPPGGVEPVIGVIGGDPAGLLPAMLQGMQAEGHKVGGLLHPDHTKHAAFFMQFVAVDIERIGCQGEAVIRQGPCLGGGGLLQGQPPNPGRVTSH